VLPITNEWTDRIYFANHDGQILCLHHRDNIVPLRTKYALPVKGPVKKLEKKVPEAEEKKEEMKEEKKEEKKEEEKKPQNEKPAAAPMPQALLETSDCQWLHLGLPNEDRRSAVPQSSAVCAWHSYRRMQQQWHSGV
jgi:hypothetical protein